MSVYYRPLLQYGDHRPAGAWTIAGGWCWATHAERIDRDRGGGSVVPVGEIPDDVAKRLRAKRAPLLDLAMVQPRIMGILNVTPDSFSDGGQFAAPEAAARHGAAMAEAGADILDIGGESTRPGADTVPAEVEIARTEPVIAALNREVPVPISIDTRKGAVAEAAFAAGAGMLNDVAALSFDDRIAGVAAAHGVPVCLMHAQGDPQTMQNNPRYDDVLLDVYDFLEARIAVAEAAGIPRDRIVVDPGIGFGKTLEHNLALLRGLSLFHGLGCPILIGASRKRFIGTLSGADAPADRMPGSVAVALAAVAQGVQIVRVHDISATRQALTLWTAATGQGEFV
ncbi:MAG: dihydropteroate synthase [Pseudomonadota bacterium]